MKQASIQNDESGNPGALSKIVKTLFVAKRVLYFTVSDYNEEKDEETFLNFYKDGSFVLDDDATPLLKTLCETYSGGRYVSNFWELRKMVAGLRMSGENMNLNFYWDKPLC